MTKAVVFIAGWMLLMSLRGYYDGEVKDNDYWRLDFPIDFLGNMSAYQSPQACLNAERDAVKPRSRQPHSNLTCLKLIFTSAGKSCIQFFRPTFCGLINDWSTPSPDLQRITEIVWKGLLQMSLPLYLEIVRFSCEAIFREPRYNKAFSNMYLRLKASDGEDELLQDMALKSTVRACFRKAYLDQLTLNARFTDTKQAAVSQRPIPNTFLTCSPRILQRSFIGEFLASMFYEMSLFVRLGNMLSQLHTKDVSFSVPCFNARLRWAANIYNTPGRWDISKDCVLTIREMSVKILHLFIAVCLQIHADVCGKPSIASFLLAT